MNHDPGNRYAEASQFILDGAYRFHAATGPHAPRLRLPVRRGTLVVIPAVTARLP